MNTPEGLQSDMNPAGFSHDQTNVGHQREREEDDLKKQ